MDGLSRLILKTRELLEETVIASLRSEMNLCCTVKELPITQEEIRYKAKFDKFITQTNKELMNQKNKVNNIFAICNGILMYGDQVVVPTVLTRKILRDFHTGHPGICKMKALMLSYVYWQSMDKDIEDMVRTCESCTLVAKVPPIKFNQ